MSNIMIRKSLPRITGNMNIAQGIRKLGTTAKGSKPKPEGDISAVFVSLSNKEAVSLPSRFAEQKARLISGHEEQLKASWDRLLDVLKDEVAIIKENGLNVVPQIDFKDIKSAPETFQKELKKRGVAIIRNVVDEAEALKYKKDIREYIAANPQTKAFPPHDPQVYELYWSTSQIRARAHPNLNATQKFLMSAWHCANPNALISSSHPTYYADRLRIRTPKDASFALGPHIDGGSVERWEDNGYGAGHVYDKIFEGSWEQYDPWESSCRIHAESDLYGGAGNCSMFRMFQGWLSMSETAPGEGTLMVNPMLSLSTAYTLLRPFFAPRTERIHMDKQNFLDKSNWVLQNPCTSELQGANPGNGQELSDALHPHLELRDTMVHVPKINPGDYVAWHCDTIHAVDNVHNGTTDSSVMYIPVCPLTEPNAQYLARQRDAFRSGLPGPDFPGGKGESEHVGRPSEKLVREFCSEESLQAFGLQRWEKNSKASTSTETQLIRSCNKILGF